jgi:response regulator RpfG family c-di-GMP phosphodiesterase
MDGEKPMRLLLIEDEESDCLKFSECARRRTDIKFIGMTDSCEEGVKLVKSRLPEGVILDLQLVKGSGSGLRFLELLNDAELTLRPVTIVTTSNQSDVVYKRVEELGADWFFSKVNKDYNEDFVIDTLLSLRQTLYAKQKKDSCSRGNLRKSGAMVESSDDRRDRIYRRIDAELDLIGIRVRLQGRIYLREAIYLKIHSEKQPGSSIEQVAQNHRHAYGTINKVMQTAINNAWDNADIDEIHTHYTARVSSKTGVPSPSDFIHYYADRIRNSI